MLKQIKGYIPELLHKHLLTLNYSVKDIELISVLTRQLIDVKRYATKAKLNTSAYKNDYAPLSKTKLVQIHKKLPILLRELVKLDIFQTDGKYFTGKKCKSYRINPIYMKININERILFNDNTRGFFKVFNITQKPLLNTYEKFKALKEEEIKNIREIKAQEIENTTTPDELLNVIKHTISAEDIQAFYHTIQNLRIDDVSAFKHIERTLNAERAKILNSKKSVKSKEKAIKALDISALYQGAAIDNITEGKKFFKIDDFSGRIHTNLTNLKSDLRQFVYFDFDYIKEYTLLDIKNSQPFILSQLFKKEIHTQYKDILEPYSHLFEFDEDKRPTDVNEFIKHAEKGQVYEYYASKTDMTRDEVKKTLFSTIFYKEDPDSLRHSKNAQKLMNITPNIFKTAHQVKTLNDTPNQYKEMARLLQMIEIKYMFNIITPTLRRAGINNILSIHDAVFMNRIHLKNAQTEILKEFKRRNLTPPVFKTELCL